MGRRRASWFGGGRGVNPRFADSFLLAHLLVLQLLFLAFLLRFARAVRIICTGPRLAASFGAGKRPFDALPLARLFLLVLHV